MATDLEAYAAYKLETQDAFNAWNEKQPDNRKILNRLPWTIIPNNVTFSAGFEKKAFPARDGKPAGVNNFKKIKGVSPQGGEVAAKMQSPSVLAPKGYCTVKTDNGPLKTIICVYDTENPEHKLFLDNIESRITNPAIHEIIRNAGAFGFQEFEAIQVFDEATMASEQYRNAVMLVRGKMAKIVNRIKIDKKTVDFKSPLRTIFYGPMDFDVSERPEDPLCETKTHIETTVNLKLTPGRPPHVIKLDQLYMICEGWEEREFPVQKNINGVMQTTTERRLVKGEPKGMECSPEANFTKLNSGSKPSTKMTCPSITITRFQIAQRGDTQASKSKAFDEYGVEDDFTAQMNMDSLLAGLANAATALPAKSQVPVGGGGFNPMGLDSNITGSQSAGGSLLGSVQNQNQQPPSGYDSFVGGHVQQSIHTNSPPQTPIVSPVVNQGVNVSSLNSVPGVGISQQMAPVMPQPFNGSNFNFPNQVQSSGMPGLQSMGIPNVNMGTSQTGDRLASFNMSIPGISAGNGGSI